MQVTCFSSAGARRTWARSCLVSTASCCCRRLSKWSSSDWPRERAASTARPTEVARVLDLMETVEPLLRRAAGFEIDTSAPLEDVVAAVLEVARTPG
jgi:hypothetical protein